MSALAESLMMAGGSNSAVGSFNGVDYVDDVFSTYLYTGNGSEQTIANGIDLSTSDKVATFVGRLQASDAAASDNFGNAVAVSADGNTMIVSAQLDDNSGGSNAGSAYIFTRSGGVWSHQARLQASDALANDQFSISVSLNADGNTAAVGAWQDDNSGGADAGSVYIFTRTDGVWTQQARLQSDTPAATDYFGYAVSLSSTGNVIAIGSHYDDNSGGTNAGSAYIFTRSGVTWTQQARVQASDAAANDQIAYSLSLSADGKTLAVGAHGDDNSGGVDAGSVYIYTETGGVWSQQARLQASDAALSDYFGYAVSISADGNTLAVGAHCNNTNAGADAGSVYIFTRSGVTWSQQADIQPSNARASDTFGFSVSISADGNTLAVGASWDDSNGTITDHGSAYLFTRSGSVWTQQLHVKATDAAVNDYFGYSVSISGDGSVMVVGANSDDNSGGADAGSVYTYSISNNTRTNRGGMVWIKNRDAISGHVIFDTVRGSDTTRGKNALLPNSTSQQTVGYGSAFFHGSGVDVMGAIPESNAANVKFASWTFRKAQRFFDVVTYTGDGTIGREVPHTLGMRAGMVITKDVNTSGTNWVVWHRSITNNDNILLNTDYAQSAVPYDGLRVVTDTTFQVSHSTVTTDSRVNDIGATYVAYVFAHDIASDGVIRCGGYTGSGTLGQDIDVGFEPQYIMVKPVSQAGNWQVLDDIRGFGYTHNSFISPNTGAADTGYSGAAYFKPTPTGFRLLNNVFNDSSVSFIYVAIRRPNKPLKSGAQNYTTIKTSTPSTTISSAAGFVSDLVIERELGVTGDWRLGSRMFGQDRFYTGNSTAANTGANYDWRTMSGVVLSTVNTGQTNAAMHFKRAPGFMDVVGYTGTGTITLDFTHGLKAEPELVIIKGINTATGWPVYVKGVAGTGTLMTNNVFTTDPTLPQRYNGYISGASNTTCSVSAGNNGIGSVNVANEPYMAIMFASLPGICKIGTYVGNGSTQTINCGFTTGARFVMIKCVSGAGNWYVWDTVRGIIAGNDPYIMLNQTNVEVVGYDSIDPDVTGFTVNLTLSSVINEALSTYMFLAIA